MKLYYTILSRAAAIIVIIFLTFSAHAQNNSNSPYSRFGIGDIIDPALAGFGSMGSPSATFYSPNQINPGNPASYSRLATASYEIGLFAKRSSISDGNENFNSWGGNLQYFSLGFPLHNTINDVLDRVERKVKYGMNFTLAPISDVGYSIVASGTDDELGEVNQNFNGRGGLLKFHWGGGVSIDDFSVGLNFGYIFGNISNTQTINFLDLDFPFSSVFQTDYHLNGIDWNLGAMYTFHLDDPSNLKEKNKRSVTVGINGNPSHDMNVRQDIFNRTSIALTGTGGTQVFADTLTKPVILDQKGDARMPSKLGLGVFYENQNKFGIGLNYDIVNWSQYENDADPIELKNTFRSSIGGYFIPNSKSITSFFDRIKYQWGVFYRTDPISVLDDNLNHVGVQVGFGLPLVFNRKTSIANFGFTYGIKGLDTAIEERYFQVNFGFTFNDDQWFLKRKYN